MKKKRKLKPRKVIALLVVVLTSMFSYYVSSIKDANKEITIYLSDNLKQTNSKKSKIYSKKLAKLFYDKEQKLDYRGYGEYGYYLKTKNTKAKSNKLTIYMKGELNDSINFADVYLNYEIDDNKVIEKVKVNYSYPHEKQCNTLNSIIPQKIILQLPLKQNLFWHQKFKYNKKEYDSITKISKISKIKDRNVYETTTTVNNIEGFKDKTYIEKRIYTEGVGLTQFTMSPPQQTKLLVDNNVFYYKLNNVK